LENDLKLYAASINEGKTPRLLGLLDADLEKFTQAKAKEVEGKDVETKDDPTVSPAVEKIISRLNQLIEGLVTLRTADGEQLPLCMNYLLNYANRVSILGPAGKDEERADKAPPDPKQALARLRFLLRRYCDQETKIWLDYLTAALLSTKAHEDLVKVNPYLGDEKTSGALMDVMTAFCLRVNRMGLINRVLNLTEELCLLLKKLSGPKYNQWLKNNNTIQRSNFHKLLLLKSASLAESLLTKRFTMNAETKAFDPRFVVFEYMFDILLREQQEVLMHKFIKAFKTGASRVEQMIMGAGKTSVIAPLMALILADGERLLTLVVPDSLLEQSRTLMRTRFTRIVPKRIHTFSFDRNIRQVNAVTQLYDKLNDARKTRGVVVTTPDAVKSLMLKYLENLNNLEKMVITRPQDRKRYEIESEMGDTLSKILHLWKAGTLILDEVDLLLHPLKSELNFPIGEKQLLDMYKQRYLLPIHLMDAFFYAETGVMSTHFKDNTRAKELLDRITVKIHQGIENKSLQTSPHLVLLDKGFYQEHLQGLMAEWALLWLRANNYCRATFPDEHALYYLENGPPRDNPTHREQLKQRKLDGKVLLAEVAKHEEDQKKVLNLAHDWLFSYLPHCIAKINRVSYGLLSKSDIEAGERKNMPKSRSLVAVPFIGKDVPSPASEFAHPDILVGLTILAYRIEGLRIFDLRKVVQDLQRQMNEGTGPISLREPCATFKRWVDNSLAYMKLLEERKKGQREGKEEKKKQEDEEPEEYIMELPMFQLGDNFQMDALFRRLQHFPPTVHHYLEMVFEKVLQHSKHKLSASGQELGGDVLFRQRFGFSGTPSDLMPKELGECGYEEATEGKIMSVMTSPDVVSYEEVQGKWSVQSLLEDIARRQPRPHALIDTGALITGMTNEQVARFLLDHGLDCDGVVFLDKKGKQILVRETLKVMSLAQCGIPKERYFTFYDQVNTTGQDIKQALNGYAVQTLGKDMTFRDYSQGAFRMRQIAQGQCIHLYIIPEVMKLIRTEFASGLAGAGKGQMQSQVSAWLMLNSMRSEKLQYMQLCVQNIANVWRKEAFAWLLSDTKDPSPAEKDRFMRFKKDAQPEERATSFEDSKKAAKKTKRKSKAAKEEPLSPLQTGALAAAMSAAMRGLPVSETPEVKSSVEPSSPIDDSSKRKKAKKAGGEEKKKEGKKSLKKPKKKIVIQGPTGVADLRAAIEVFREKLKFEIESDVEALNVSFQESLLREAERFQRFLGDLEANPGIQECLKDAAGSTGTMGDLGERDLSTQMQNEQEQEQEQQQQARQEREVRIMFSREDEQQEPWDLWEIGTYYSPLQGQEVKQAKEQKHAFYPVSAFSLEASYKGDFQMPNTVLFSRNYFRPEWADRGQRRLKNVTVVLEWLPLDLDKPLGLTRQASTDVLPNDNQTADIKKAFSMFDAGGGKIPASALATVMHVLGERPSKEELEALEKSAPDLTYKDFEDLVFKYIRFQREERRFFVAVSLREAQTLRRVVHVTHPILLNRKADRATGLALRSLPDLGSILDKSPLFGQGGGSDLPLALQCFRYLNCDCFYDNTELALLLRGVQNNPIARRRAFFENLMMCRRRDRLKWDDTPLKQVFSLSDQYHLLAFRAKVVRIRQAIRNKGLMVGDAFNKFDVVGNNKLNATELANACAWLKITGLDNDDIAELIVAADCDKDGLLDYNEFIGLLRAIDSETEAEEDELRETKLRRTPSAASDDRLSLTKEFQEQYERDEKARLQRIRDKELKQQKKQEREEAQKRAAIAQAASEIERARKLEEQLVQTQLARLADWKVWECTWDHTKNEEHVGMCITCGRPRQEVEYTPKLSPIEEYAGKPPFWTCLVCLERKVPDPQMPWGIRECLRHKNSRRPEADKIVQEKRESWVCPTCGRFNLMADEYCDICSTVRPSAPKKKV